MSPLRCFLVLCLGIVSLAQDDEWQGIGIHDENVKGLAEWVSQKHDSTLVRLCEAKMQVVSGVKYQIKMILHFSGSPEPQLCDVQVWEKSSSEKETLQMLCVQQQFCP